MSKGMFANPKAALGFAAAVIAIAIVASIAAKAYLPSVQEEPKAVVAAEEADVAASDRPSNQATKTQGAGWASSDLSDSWASSDTQQRPSPSNQPANEEGLESSQSFGNYSPAQSASGSTVVQNSGGNGRGPRITSRAAPNAPPIPSRGEEAPVILQQ